MKRYIKSSKSLRDTCVAYLVSIDVEFEVADEEFSIAAAEYVHHPTKPTNDTFFFTDDSLDHYDDFITTLILNIESQGLVLTNKDLPKFQSDYSYAIYPRFKLENSSGKDTFALLVRMGDHNKDTGTQKDFKGATFFRQFDMQVYCIVSEVGRKGKHPIYEIIAFRNELEAIDTVIDICDKFKYKVSIREDKRILLKEWSNRLADEFNITFDYDESSSSGNPQYYFYVPDRKNPVVIYESELYIMNNYGSFRNFVCERLGFE